MGELLPVLPAEKMRHGRLLAKPKNKFQILLQ